MNPLEVYALAIGANLTFSTASMVFSIYARRFAPMWINQVKVSVAFLAFLAAMFITQKIVPIPPIVFCILLLSGFVGLCLGDIFLFRAYATLGAGRSLVLFSFQPLLLGIYGYFFLGQIFTMNQTFSVACMVACICIFMFERNRTTGSWDAKSFFWAFLGIALDAFGVMFTRSAYEFSPGLETFQVNVIRCMGALLGYLLLSPRSYSIVWKDLKILPKNEVWIIVIASIGGCFVSLTLYLAALKYAHVGTLTAISITGPVWVAILESLYHKRMPNKYLLLAFGFFLAGFYLMVMA
jgi:drug/metabolite transporter (DMT)-like permease